jgi:metal-sulfur cluster biosynthetic enzyme
MNEIVNKEEQVIWDVLQPIQDPELGASIVDLGLIYRVAVKDNQVIVTMTFTTPLCPFGQTLIESVRSAVKKIGMQVKVDITFDPPWGINKIKPELREQFMFPQDII